MQIIAMGDYHGKAPLIEKRGLTISTGDIIELSNFRKPEIERLVRDGKELMKYVNQLGVVVSIPGNHDLPFPADKKFLSQRYYEMVEYSNIIDIQHSAVKYGDYSIVGYGGTAFPEIMEDGDIEYFSELYEFYASLMKKLENIILVSHNPPFKSGLDRVGNGYVGSILVRELIKDFSPLMVISGHVHERQGRKKIKDSVVINHGPAMEGWYAEINLESRRVRFKKSQTINFNTGP